MKSIFEKYWNAEYSVTEWTFMKCSVGVMWLLCIGYVLWSFKPIAYPVSFCTLVDCNTFNPLAVRILLAFCAITAVVFYIQEKLMVLSLGVIAAISVLVFTVSDSMGFYDRFDMISCIFIAQFIAYLFFSGNKLSQRRIQFPVQAIAGGYMLSAMNKFYNSGIDWALESKNFALQVKKGYSFAYADYGRLSALHAADTLSQFFLHHPYITTTLLLLSLVFEFFAFLAIFDKRLAITMGFLLLSMHLGILVLMNVFLFAVVPAVIIFLVNPVYLIYILVRRK